MDIQNSERDKRVAKLKTGIIASWLSLVIFPAGIFLGAIGICAGPRSEAGAVALLAIGAGGIATAIYSAFRILRGFRFGSVAMRLGGILSLAVGILVGFLG
jgi:hypothetical protein